MHAHCHALQDPHTHRPSPTPPLIHCPHPQTELQRRGAALAAAADEGRRLRRQLAAAEGRSGALAAALAAQELVKEGLLRLLAAGAGLGGAGGGGGGGGSGVGGAAVPQPDAGAGPAGLWPPAGGPAASSWRL